MQSDQLKVSDLYLPDLCDDHEKYFAGLVDLNFQVAEAEEETPLHKRGCFVSIDDEIAGLVKLKGYRTLLALTSVQRSDGTFSLVRGASYVRNGSRRYDNATFDVVMPNCREGWGCVALPPQAMIFARHFNPTESQTTITTNILEKAQQCLAEYLEDRVLT